MLEEPELITLIPEEEPEELPTVPKLGKRLAVQIVTVICLKVATGIAIKNMAKTIREMDLLYPEHLDRIRWRH
jgi:Holliday junction resolvasome RuvABC DNA-binding subunit